MADPPDSAPRIWRAGPRAAAALVPAITRTAMLRRGFAASRVLLDWDDIVGPGLADATRPDRLKRRSESETDLILRVRPAMALEVEHLAPLLIERINSHFGFKAVTRIRLAQGSVPMRRRKIPKPEPVLPPVERARLASTVAAVEDPDLRAVLEQLGTRVRAKEMSRGPRG